MNAHDLRARVAAAASDALFERLYGAAAVPAARARLLGLIDSTVAGFPETTADMRVFTAAGRTELGGNHTDHNRGKVLAASIQLDALACVSPRNDRTVIFRSTKYPDVVVDLSDLSARKEELGTTEALVRGIAAEFTARGTPVRGFTANADSTVLSGSGLSSSAAVEVLFGAIFDGLYGGGKRSAVELAQIGQKAENVYFGKPCGLMDQTACASGGAVAIDFADPAHPVVTNIDFNLERAGYALCVVDTGGNHADLTPDYAAVPAEMKSVAAAFGKSVLREVDEADFAARVPELRAKVGDRALLRAYHFYAENVRVDAMKDALQRLNNIAGGATASVSGSGSGEATAAAISAAVEEYLALVTESGGSSWELLQNVFSTKAPDEQGVTLALALTRKFLKQSAARGTGRGACRVHGGGFAGTIQAYVPLDRVNEYVEAMKPVFGDKAVTVLRIRPVGAAELHF